MQMNCYVIFTVDTFNIGTVFLQTICIYDTVSDQTVLISFQPIQAEWNFPRLSTGKIRFKFKGC